MAPKNGEEKLPRASIGILGGTGLYEIEGIEPMSGKSVSRRPSATPPTLSSSARSKGNGWPSSAATAAATGSCRPRSTTGPTSTGSRCSASAGSSPSTPSARSRTTSGPGTSSSPTSSSTGRAARTPSSAVVSSPTSASASPSARSFPRPSTRPPTAWASRPTRRDLHLHRGAGLLEPGRVHDLQVWGCDVIGMTARHRGQARPRGRDLLRHHEPRHRLRRLARRGGGRLRGAHPAEPEAQRRERQGHHQAAVAGLGPEQGDACGCGGALRNTIVTQPPSSRPRPGKSSGSSSINTSA